MRTLPKRSSRIWFSLVVWLTFGYVQAADKPEVFVQTGEDHLKSMIFSPDGRTLASGDGDSTIVLWDVRSGRELRSLHGNSGVNSVVFSPDGLTLASGSVDSVIELWDARDGRELRSITCNSPVENLAFSRDGRTLFSSNDDQTIRSWDVASGRESASARSVEGYSWTFSADGRTLVSGIDNRVIKLWNVSSGQETRAFNSERYNSVALSPSGRTLASGGDGTIRLWDVINGLERHPLVVSKEGGIFSLEVLPNDRVLASTDYHSITFWDLSSNSPIRTVRGAGGGVNSAVEKLAFSPDGRTLASGNLGGTIMLWDVATGRNLSTLNGKSSPVHSVAFSPDGHLLASGGGVIEEYQWITLWDVESGVELQRLGDHKVEATSSVVFSPDGRMVAASGVDGVSLWDVASGRELLPDTRVPSHPESVAFSPDGSTLAAGSDSQDEKNIILWSVPTGGEIRRFGGEQINSLAFSPDGHTLASGTEHGALLIDVASGRELSALRFSPDSHFEESRSVAFSPNGEVLASGSDNTIQLWELTGRHERRSLNGHLDTVLSVAFSPDGRTLASGSRDKTIKFWDVSTGRELRTIEVQSAVRSVAFSLDGRTLASGDEDDMVKLWDVASGAQRISLITFNDGSSVRITPQGYYDYQGNTAEDNLNVRVGNEVTGIGAYREIFYRPDLVRLALAGQKLPDGLHTLDSVKPAPDVALRNVPAQITGDLLNLQVSLTDRGGGIGNIRVFVNGSAVSQTQARDLGIAQTANVSIRTLAVRLVPGSNDIRVIAFNADDSVSSNPALTTVKANYTSDHKPTLYALVVGIQHFENPNLELKYSIADATAVADVLRRTAAPIFDKVKVELLITPEQTTKQKLLASFARYQGIDPDDVFLFYVASHGTVEGEQLATKQYYLIPSNVGLTSDEALQRDAIGQQVLKQLIANIPATKKVLFLDTCQAGALGDALGLGVRGSTADDAAVKVLSGAVGSTVLSASTSQEQALEGKDGHGLFTWVLLQGLGGKADVRNSGYVSTIDLAGYVGDEVPKVAEHDFRRKQFPNLHNAGQSFPIVSTRFSVQ